MTHFKPSSALFSGLTLIVAASVANKTYKIEQLNRINDTVHGQLHMRYVPEPVVDWLRNIPHVFTHKFSRTLAYTHYDIHKRNAYGFHQFNPYSGNQCWGTCALLRSNKSMQAILYSLYKTGTSGFRWCRKNQQKMVTMTYIKVIFFTICFFEASVVHLTPLPFNHPNRAITCTWRKPLLSVLH